MYTLFSLDISVTAYVLNECQLSEPTFFNYVGYFEDTVYQDPSYLYKLLYREMSAV
jgi:hypothetical protein